ncbi:hypothetical protein R1sor_021910 [Riccia sorocarpa]|uniref:VWFA domain-containing protein n=1 Tax=Riccia sorocarpa TaxID=122646 RepID=A0ABD3GML6_9MARC
MSILVALQILVLVCCLQQLQAIPQQPSPGNQLFTQAVTGVKTIADALGKAYDNLCPGNCDSTCSQDLCRPLPDNSSPICFKKARNESILFNCTNPHQEQRCISVSVTIDKSSVTYVRENGNPKMDATVFQRSAVCRTQRLDGTFRIVSQAFGQYFAQYYVGTIDGTLRTFPGREDGSPGNCVLYDSRRRPWYNGAIYCPNHLVILIDRGRSMKDDVSSGPSSSKLDVVKTFASSLMETVYADSYVNVFAFGGGSDITYSKSVQVQFNSSDPNLDPLKSRINSTTLNVTTNTQPDDFVSALNVTLKAFQDPDVKSRNLLQNVILLTDGVFTETINYDDPSVKDVFTRLKSLNITLFIYGITLDHDDGMKNLSDHVSGSYQDIHEVQDFSDPLFSMGSYLGYLATCHRNMYADPFWSPNYRDYFNISDIVTVAAPAFSADNSFVGVAAIDVILEELGPDWSADRNDFLNAVTEQRSNQSKVHVLPQTQRPEAFDDSSTCSNSYENSYPLCPSRRKSTGPPDKGICCDSCIRRVHKGSNSNLDIILGPIGGFVLLLVLIGACICMFRKRKPPTPALGGSTPPQPAGSPDDRWARPL